jgi:hypothetical protein
MKARRETTVVRFQAEARHRGEGEYSVVSPLLATQEAAENHLRALHMPDRAHPQVRIVKTTITTEIVSTATSKEAS